MTPRGCAQGIQRFHDVAGLAEFVQLYLKKWTGNFICCSDYSFSKSLGSFDSKISTFWIMVFWFPISIFAVPFFEQNQRFSTWKLLAFESGSMICRKNCKYFSSCLVFNLHFQKINSAIPTFCWIDSYIVINSWRVCPSNRTAVRLAANKFVAITAFFARLQVREREKHPTLYLL